MTLKKTGYFATYFHPWEFSELTKYKIVPFYIKHNSGDKLVERLDKLVKKLKNCEYKTYSEYANTYLDKA